MRCDAFDHRQRETNTSSSARPLSHEQDQRSTHVDFACKLPESRLYANSRHTDSRILNALYHLHIIKEQNVICRQLIAHLHLNRKPLDATTKIRDLERPRKYPPFLPWYESSPYASAVLFLLQKTP